MDDLQRLHDLRWLEEMLRTLGRLQRVDEERRRAMVERAKRIPETVTPSWREEAPRPRLKS